MKRTALFASVALFAGLSAPAFAQQIAGFTVSPEDWVHVENHCAMLAGDDVAFDADATETPTGLTTSVELSLLTYEDCVQAGLISETPGATGLTPGGPMQENILNPDLDDNNNGNDDVNGDENDDGQNDDGQNDDGDAGNGDDQNGDVDNPENGAEEEV